MSASLGRRRAPLARYPSGCSWFSDAELGYQAPLSPNTGCSDEFGLIWTPSQFTLCLSSYVRKRRAAACLTLHLYQFLGITGEIWEGREQCIPSLPTPHMLLVPKLSCQLPSVWGVQRNLVPFCCPCSFAEPLGSMSCMVAMWLY